MVKSNLQKLQRLRDIAWVLPQTTLLQHYLQARDLHSIKTVELNKLFKNAVLVTLRYDQTAVRPESQTTFRPEKLLALGIATYVICWVLLPD